MTPLEKVFYGLLLALATSFGSIIYHTAVTRVAALESQTKEIEQEAKARVIADQIVITEMRVDLKYLRQALDRIERKLDTLPAAAVISKPITQFGLPRHQGP